MRNTRYITIAILVSVFLFSAASVSADGLVPCGGPGDPCQLCDFFVLIDNIIDFTLFKLVIPVAALMFIFGGFYLLIASGNPELFNKAKSILTAAVIGLVIIFAAFIFVGTFLEMIGLAEWTENIYKSWWEEGFFQLPCP